tara:strand:- start:1278 stop:1478 length:201 start_codon:yes stop_codon:yes gene_type:complete
MNQTNKRSLNELNTYWNERLSFLAQSDRLDDAEALYSEFNIDGKNVIYEAFDYNEDILFMEYLNDL